jgi:hypothetical protein
MVDYIDWKMTTFYDWSPWYSWNIAEGGVKHQKSNQSIIFYFMRMQQIENLQ